MLRESTLPFFRVMIRLLVIALLLAARGFCANQVNVHVVDESGNDLPGAEVVIAFDRLKTSVDYEGITGDDGRFEAADDSSFGVFVLVNKEGF